MEQETKVTQSRILKALAVLGFVVMVVLGTWLAVRLVALVPSAFSSLANLAESVQDGQKSQNTIELSSEENVVSSQESFEIAWSEVKRDGVYTLSYTCVEGVSLDLKLADNSIVPVSCGNAFMLPDNMLSVQAVFSSAKKRFVDVPYTIGFIKDGEVKNFIETNKTLTIVNASIPEGVVLAEETSVEIIPKPTAEVVPTKPTVSTTPSTPSKPVLVTPKPTTKTVYTTTYKVPTSNPSGYADLAVTYLGVGVLNGNLFTPKAELKAGDKGAFQFMVKNIGTKDSSAWSFEADLPSGESYDAGAQKFLKVNEQTTLTLAFGDSGSKGTKTFGAEISGGNDSKSSNNHFTWAVFVK